MTESTSPFQCEAELSSVSNSSEISFAISSATESAKEAEGVTLLILQRHIKSLCELQLSKLAELN